MTRNSEQKEPPEATVALELKELRAICNSQEIA